MTPEQRDLLILRYLDGTASAAEVAKLEEQLWSDEEGRLLVRDLAEQAVGMADFARERMIQSSQQGQDKPQSLPQRRLRKWWLAAACIALVLGGIAFWVASTDRAAVTIAHVSGAVSFTPRMDKPDSVWKAVNVFRWGRSGSKEQPAQHSCRLTTATQ